MLDQDFSSCVKPTNIVRAKALKAGEDGSTKFEPVPCRGRGRPRGNPKSIESFLRANALTNAHTSDVRTDDV